MIAEQAPVTADWIASRSGVRSRRHASPSDTLANMGAGAADAALADAGVRAAEVDLVIVATATHRRPMPSVAPQVATLVGATNTGAFDLNAACAGFSYALAMAASAVKCRSARNVLVIGAERLTDWTSPAVTDTFAIMADGAGAVLVTQSDRDDIRQGVWGSDGSRAQFIEMPNDAPEVRMKGPLVYKWAVATLPDVARAACKQADVALDEIDWLVMHQANERIIDTVATALGFPMNRVCRDIVVSGNTSAASIPMGLAQLRREGQARGGQHLLILGFGSGLTYSAQVVRMP
jgi:3-oxoacyl-[acyl-carrier-protein] synthase-3